jgi:hypothetical protein
MKNNDHTKYYQSYLYIGCVWSVIVLIMLFLTSCYGTYYISDAEYSDLREEHASVTYYDNQIYWGWNSGWYYYYGTPHYYPWYYYYNSCPPSHYTTTTHVIIKRPVNKPTHRPNRPNTHRPSVTHIDGKSILYTPNRNTKVTTTPNRNTRVKTNTNYTRPKNNTKVKTNRSNSNRSNKTNTKKPR